MSVLITLEQKHIDYATKIGHLRRASAKERSRPPKNGAPTDDARALKIDIEGALCECAGYLYLSPITWNRFKLDGLRDLADLGDWIDVKGIQEERRRLVVQKDDQDRWAYLLISGHAHPTYTIFGWMFGSEAKLEPMTDPTGTGRHAHFIDKQWLRAPEVLLEKVRLTPRGLRFSVANR